MERISSEERPVRHIHYESQLIIVHRQLNQLNNGKRAGGILSMQKWPSSKDWMGYKFFPTTHSRHNDQLNLLFLYLSSINFPYWKGGDHHLSSWSVDTHPAFLLPECIPLFRLYFCNDFNFNLWHRVASDTYCRTLKFTWKCCFVYPLKGQIHIT